MKTWLIDTNVLLDVIGADQAFGESSRQALADCAEAGMLIINPIVYAEVAVWMTAREELDALLPSDLFMREGLSWDAAYLAAQAFGRYRMRGGRKPRMLADFLIGAHAAVASHCLVTRDEGYRRYFEVEILNPAR